MRLSKLMPTLLGLLGLLLVQPVLAHHSQAEYDPNNVLTLKGVVTKFEWMNPHSWLYVDVMNDQGQIEKWEFETLSPNSLTRAKWKKTQIKPGDQVTISAIGSRKGGHRARLNRVVMADGFVLRPGREPGTP